MGDVLNVFFCTGSNGKIYLQEGITEKNVLKSNSTGTNDWAQNVLRLSNKWFPNKLKCIQVTSKHPKVCERVSKLVFQISV